MKDDGKHFDFTDDLSPIGLRLGLDAGNYRDEQIAELIGEQIFGATRHVELMAR